MEKISIDTSSVLKLALRYKELARKREQHNRKLEELLDKLDDVKSGGFVEEIIEKLITHKEHVDSTQIENIIKLVEFLNNLVENFIEVDKNTIRN